MHKDCIILCHETDNAGNLLCLKEINGKTLLEYLSQYFKKYHICKVVFSISTQKDVFKEYILNNREAFTFAFDFSEDDDFKGSGTSIVNALQYSDTPDVLIMRGHNFFNVNLDDLIAWQQTKMGDITIALSYQTNTAGNTCIHLDNNNQITEFSNGAKDKAGLISGGIYCLFRPSFLNINFPQSFTFEKDFIQKHIKDRDCIGMICDEPYLNFSNELAIEEVQKVLDKTFNEKVDE